LPADTPLRSVNQLMMVANSHSPILDLDRRKVAITDCDHANIDEELAVCQRENIRCDVYQLSQSQELINNLQSYEVLINQYARFTEEVFAGLPNLKVLVRYGVGLNNICIPAATQHGVRVCNVPDYGTQEVASHALALMLALARKIIPMTQSVKDGVWDYTLSIPIRRFSTMTVGIVGVGRIGKSFAAMVQPLFKRVIATDPKYGFSRKFYPEYIELVDFNTLLAESDVISIHSNLESSAGLFNKAALEAMKKDSILINVSRGGIVVESDLAEALRNHTIAAAAVDVSEKEPLPMNSPLQNCPNFLCTPHMAWYSEQASSDLKTNVAEEVARFMNGQPLKNCVNFDK
jgi:D-3-phosphoglycerate dehydrogenase